MQQKALKLMGSFLAPAIGIGAIVIIGIAVATAIRETSLAAATPALATSLPLATTTQNIIAIKQTLDAGVEQTRIAALETPWSLAATVPPIQTLGPTSTPDFSGFDHRNAGAGVIVSDTLTIKGYPVGVVNQWYEIPKGFRVFAGSTTDPNQGAVAVLAPGISFENPEVYITPLAVGPVEIQDAQGERLVLRARNDGTLFFFDVSTRQFVDSLTVTITAPTVTPRPTFTSTATLQPVPSPTFGLPPMAYPGTTPMAPGNGYPAPTVQVTAIP